MTSKEYRAHVKSLVSNIIRGENMVIKYILIPVGIVLAALGGYLQLALNIDLGYWRHLEVLPGVKSYQRKLQAIEKLRAIGLNFETHIKKDDDGFDDLINLLVENRWLSRKRVVDELILRRQHGIYTLHVKIESQTNPVNLGQHNLNQIKELAEKSVQRYIAKASWLFIFIGAVITIVGSFL